LSYRVCIPTAGIGSRLGDLTKFINKSLVSIANRPTLSHLIEQFPADVEFVIALGHKGHLVREFLELAYPHRQFFFAHVPVFEGVGSGLGLSLLACKQYLQQPFVFISCDTLVKEAIPFPDENWMAYADITALPSYRTLVVEREEVVNVFEKAEGNGDTLKPYIGLAGIRDYQSFWTAMEQGGEHACQAGEVYGMRQLLPQKIGAYRFTWYDTGNQDALACVRTVYHEAGAPNILEKSNEAIWFVDGHVIKFSDDQSFIANRVKRVHELRDYVPEVTDSQPHMYRYSKVAGNVLSEVVTLPLFEKLLEHGKSFWVKKTLNPVETQNFHGSCERFYHDKTIERVALFYKNFSQRDGTESINGQIMPKLDTLLNSADWGWLSDGLPGRFHGDFHFENILWNEIDQRFVFLDWRQDFGGDLGIGDIYYDFAKLLHGLIISHELITKNFYSVTWRSGEITYDFHRKQILVECEQRFGAWIEAEGYDKKKVWTLTALIFLNIAALHHNPYSLLLFALGKVMLKNELDK